MTLQADINTLNTWANECRILLWNLEDGIDGRTVSTYNRTVHGSIGNVAVTTRDAVYELIEAMQFFVYGYTSSYSYTKWLDVHLGLYEQESALTWKTICEAWAADDFAGRGVTIAFIDRMRELIWNEPFYVAWAAKPEEEF